MRSPVAPPPACWTLGSELDGAFAEYVKVPSTEVFRVECDWDDTELASIPCAYSTAENLLHRANVTSGERVLVTGASGGVGSAAVPAREAPDAEVVAVAGAGKEAGVRALGADVVLPRDGDPRDALGARGRRRRRSGRRARLASSCSTSCASGGRLATAGAIAGPIVELDLRTLYLQDLTLSVARIRTRHVFANLVGYVERGEIRPVVARTYPLHEIVQAQRDFIAKRFVGKLVLIVGEDGLARGSTGTRLGSAARSSAARAAPPPGYGSA